MPKLSVRVPAYCRHRQSGQARVHIDRRDILLGTYGSAASKEKYNALIAEWVANGRKLPTPAPEVTILHVLARFKDHAITYYRHPDGTPTGEWENFRLAIQPLKRLYGRLPAAEFGPLKLKAIRDEMIRPRKEKDPQTGEERTVDGWSRNYANRQTFRIRQVFRWAAEEEMIPVTVYDALRTVKALARGRTKARETKRVTIIGEEHVEAVLPFVSRQIAAMIELQSVTGARGGELFKMRGRDIDMTKPTWEFRPSTHKTMFRDHERVIFFGSRAQEIIRQFLKPDPEAFLFSPVDADAERRDALHKRRIESGTPLSCGNRPGTNVVKNPKRKPRPTYNKHSYARAIARACDKADAWQKGGRIVGNDERVVPRWHPHQLRHNAATNFRRDYSIEAVQVLLGQKTLRMAELYAERNVELARKIMAEVG